MKKLVLLAGLALSLGTSFDSGAQVRVSLQIGRPVAQQPWYANDNDYYYMPEQGVYYNTRRRVYVYNEGGKWLYANRLPERFGNVTYSNTHYVRVRDRSPFDRDNDYRQRYHSDHNGRHDEGRRDEGRRDEGRHNEGHRDNGYHNGR